MKSYEQRIEDERQFHNERFGAEHDSRESLDKWYTAIESGSQLQIDLIKEYGKDAIVLEYGCADGFLSLGKDHIAANAREFHGIDISDKAIEKAQANADAQGITQAHFTVMNAEQMTFEDNRFDLVFGRGIIHHLDLGQCFQEISRVLKPGGQALFYEPMGHNPLINGFRKKTPHMRTEDEHPLLMSDLKLAERYFSKVHGTFFGLTTLGAVPFRKTFFGSKMMKLCEQADNLLLRLPLLKENAWHVLLTFTK